MPGLNPFSFLALFCFPQPLGLHGGAAGNRALGIHPFFLRFSHRVWHDSCHLRKDQEPERGGCKTNSKLLLRGMGRKTLETK